MPRREGERARNSRGKAAYAKAALPALLIDLNFSHNLQDPFGDFDRCDYNGGSSGVIEQDQSFLQIIYTLIGDHRNTPSSLNIRNLGPGRKTTI